MPKVFSEASESFDFVIILAGTNDIGGLTNPAQVFEDIKYLHNFALQNNVKETFALTLPPIRKFHEISLSHNENILKLNKLIQDYTVKEAKVHLIDIYKGMPLVSLHKYFVYLIFFFFFFFFFLFFFCKFFIYKFVELFYQIFTFTYTHIFSHTHTLSLFL